MNKRIFAFVLGLAVLGGCQGKISPEQVKQTLIGQEKRIGMLQSLGGAFVSNKATHLLRMDDGRTVYLRSDVLDLKNEKYIGNEVEVMGGITRTTDGNQTMLVESIDLIDPEAASAEEVPEWVDYVSENLGISLKYRSDYLLKELAGNIVVQPKPVEKNDDSGLKMENDRKSLAEISFSLLSRAEDFDLAKEMGINSWENSDVLAGGYNRSKVTQKAIDAFKKTMNGGKEIVYYLKNSDGSYKISFKAGETQEDFVSDQNMFYDILASVDFGEASGQVGLDSKETEVAVVEAHKDDVKSIDSNDDLSGFSTFTSDSQKFSIQYPKSYYFGVAPAKEGAAISYQFGVKPLEEVVGEINLDIVKALPKDGKQAEFGGKKLMVVTDEDGISVYISQNNKVFRLSGRTSKEGLLKQMASTIKN
jgi:hypothetical protein